MNGAIAIDPKLLRSYLLHVSYQETKVIELINNSQGLNLIKILTHFFSALLVMIIYFPCTCSQQVTFGNRRLTPPFDLIILLQLMMEG